uniref:Uncharacterized protein n=1 Tax=viral metagenome TaxID=1070528 RepID=A0A6M3IYC3_9ZZZZ
MKLGDFHLIDGVRLGAAHRVADGSAYVDGQWSFPYHRYSYPVGQGYSYPVGNISYPSGSGWSFPWGDWSYPQGFWSFPFGNWSYPNGWSYPNWEGWSYVLGDGWSYPETGWSFPWWDGWSYKGTGWSFPKGYWSYDYVDNWSYQLHSGYSFPGGWSYKEGWSYDRLFGSEREQFTAGQVVLTSYLSAWWLNVVTRGAFGTEALGHPVGGRVVPVSWGTLQVHPSAHGFMTYHLDSMKEPWIGQVSKGYMRNRRHVLSCYAWVDDVEDGDGEVYLEADWGAGGLTAFSNPGWNGTWAAQYNDNFRRIAPNGDVDSSHTVPAGKGIYRFWVTIPQQSAGLSLRTRIRTARGDFFTDRVKLEPEFPMDTGQATAASGDWFEDSSKAWGVNQWAGKQVVIVSGVYAPLVRDVLSNTHDRIVIDGAWQINGVESYELRDVGSNSRPTAYVDEGMTSGWLQEVRGESIRGGLITLGGETISEAVGGARIRILDRNNNQIVSIGENLASGDFRGIDLARGAGVRIAEGSGGEVTVGDNIVINEFGYFTYDDDGSETVALRSSGRFTLATSNQWKQRLEFDHEAGLAFYDDANVPFVSFNPETGTVYLGKEYQAHIAITPTGVTVDGSLLVRGTVTADAFNIAQHIVGSRFDSDLPSAGEISWSDVTLNFHGEVYSVADGNTSLQYIWWDADSPEEFQESGVLPTMHPVDDVLIGENDGGTFKPLWGVRHVHGGIILADTVTVAKIYVDDILQIADGGEFVFGSGARDVDLTGFSIYQDGATAKMVGQAAGVDQWYVDTDGIWKAAGGNIYADANGFHVALSASQVQDRSVELAGLASTRYSRFLGMDDGSYITGIVATSNTATGGKAGTQMIANSANNALASLQLVADEDDEANNFYATIELQDLGNSVYSYILLKPTYFAMAHALAQINVGINTFSAFSDGVGVVSIANASTPPTSGAANASMLYAADVSSSSELFAYDEAGNAAQLTPHDPETGEWYFYSFNTKSGRHQRCDMEKLAKFIDKKFGTKFYEEWRE